MGGVLGRMFNGARAMKSMLTDLMPSTAGHGQKINMDLLPTEMTRVKYIIRNPQTNKPMKIIKMRPSPKKVIKLRRPIPKPTITESSVMISHGIHKDHRMRQLEKEQELIAEGKAPMTSDEAIMEKYFKKRPRGGSSNEVISGKIMEYQSWKPVYKAGETPSSFVTLRPQPLTHLHTDISSGDHEMLPKPEKLVSYEYERDEDDVAENEVAKQTGHRYEVTEHTGEASGEVETVETVASMESGFVPSQGMTFRSPPPAQHAPRPRQRTPSSTTTTSTTTTEAPNYPASFLKKYREREATTTRRPRKHHNKEVYLIREGEDSSEGSTTPPTFAMSSLRLASRISSAIRNISTSSSWRRRSWRPPSWMPCMARSGQRRWPTAVSSWPVRLDPVRWHSSNLWPRRQGANTSARRATISGNVDQSSLPTNPTTMKPEEAGKVTS